MKKILLSTLILAGAISLSHGQRYVGPISVTWSSTNNVAAVTTNKVFGPIYVERASEVAFQFGGRLGVSKTTNITFTLFRSMDLTGTNLSNLPFVATETGGDIASFVLTPFGTTNVCTNVSVTVGATPYFYVKVTNPNLASGFTNLVIKYGYKLP